ncbi:MAG: MBL fold metallo-hydrolase [bacterium]|nr:MBL fold metallo-hydrolase [bacterium]
MQFKQIRNATARIYYAGKVYLLDPWLAAKDAMGYMAYTDFKVDDSAKMYISMPICPLPESVERILAGVDGYIVTHIHPDHIDMNIDGTVGGPLDKLLPVFVQNEEDAEIFHISGFTDVRVLSEEGLEFGDARLIKTPALHGLKANCGSACGVVLESENEPTLYLAGDTVWYDKVKRTLDKFRPKVIVVNACAAEGVDFGRLIMNDDDVAAVVKAAPYAKIIASHMDNVAHASLTRTTLGRSLKRRKLLNKVCIPEDGQVLEFSK